MEVTHEIESKLNTRSTFIGLFSGFTAGFLNAILARLLMRVIALVVFGQGSFSIGGTAVIFLFGILAGPLFGWIYRFTFYRLRLPEILKGLLFGLVMLVAIQLPGLYISPEFRAELMAAGALGFPIFLLMNFAFMLTLAFLVARLEATWRMEAGAGKLERVGSVILGALALAGLVLLLVEMIGRPLGLLG